MGNKTKAFKKFASSGKLKDTIKARRVHQQKRKKADDKIQQRRKQRGAPKSEGLSDEEEGEDEDDEKDVKAAQGSRGGKAGGVAKTVEELFGEGGLDVSDEEDSEEEELSEDEDEDEEDDDEDEGLLDEEAMKKTMKGLAKSDPEFFKYLQENDQELLEFGQEPAKAKGKAKKVEEDEDMDSGDDEEEDEEEEEEVMDKISVSMRMVREWQNGMLKVGLRSIGLTVATLSTIIEEDSSRIPSSGTYE